MFLKYIRDNSLSMPFSALSSSMKSSLSNIFFFFITNPLIFLKFVSVELILGHVTERVTKRMTTIRSDFVAISETKSQSKITLFLTLNFVYPLVQQSANRCSAIEWSIDKTLLWVRLCSTEFGNRTIAVRIGRISERSIRHLLHFDPS